MANIFGTPNPGATLFCSSTTPSPPLFNNPSSTGTALFGTTTGTGMFNTPTTTTTAPSTNTGTGLFGSSTTGLFGTSANPSSTTTGGGLFGNPSTSTNPFPSTNPLMPSLFNSLPSSNALKPQEPDKQLIITSTKPILSLQSSNSLRFNKLSSFSDEFKKVITQIQAELMNNSLKISYAERLISRLEQNFKTVKTEGLNVVKLSKVINTKNAKIKLILSNLKAEMKKLNESLEKEKNNFRILQLGSDMTLTVPNDFLLYYTQELEERMKSYATQVEDIQSLINLYSSEESGTFKVNSDMVEEVIVELFKCIKILLADEAMLSEYVTSIKASFAELLKTAGGFNDFQIKARFESYLDRDL